MHIDGATPSGGWPVFANDLAQKNKVLTALPDADLARWLPRLERVHLPQGRVLHESGARASNVWFPTGAVIALLNATEDGCVSQVATVGREGLVGIPHFLGGDTSPTRAVVLFAGEGLRMDARAIADEFERGGPALSVLLQYGQALVTQIAQTAICNRHHGLEQQLCRWLLMSCERLPTQELVVTQELIAHMLGVRRASVTEHAMRLQHDGMIRYRRGHITVVNLERLEERVCECYRVVKAETERLSARWRTCAAIAWTPVMEPAC
jgi:CRP-like cAMP-binding protein